jgi:hypothetical protein
VRTAHEGRRTTARGERSRGARGCSLQDRDAVAPQVICPGTGHDVRVPVLKCDFGVVIVDTECTHLEPPIPKTQINGLRRRQPQKVAQVKVSYTSLPTGKRDQCRSVPSGKSAARPPRRARGAPKAARPAAFALSENHAARARSEPTEMLQEPKRRWLCYESRRKSDRTRSPNASPGCVPNSEKLVRQHTARKPLHAGAKTAIC